MKVILLETIEKLGKVGEMVEVKPGYARNYLIPFGKAIFATPQAEAEVQKKIAELKAKEETEQAELAKFAEKIAATPITIPVKVGEEGKLFGSVTTAEIAEILSKEAKTEIEKSQIEIPEPIKALGDYEVTIHLGHGISAKVKISVVSESEPKAEAKPTKKK
jgi:large subunit ribosomal protein L9